MIDYETIRKLEEAQELLHQVYNASEQSPREPDKVRDMLWQAEWHAGAALALLKAAEKKAG